MRLLVCLLICLLPTVTSAQAIASASGLQAPSEEVPLGEELDILPIAGDEDAVAIFFGLGAAMLVGGIILYHVISGNSIEDIGNDLLKLAGTVVVCGGFGYCMSNRAGTDEAPGTAYDMDALVAYATNDLTAEHRQALAEVAQERGRDGVVLQRLVETRAGVGKALGEYALDVVVVDAETAQLRPLTEDLLAPQTVLSIPIEGSTESLEAAQAEAFERIGIDT
ncbi:MAG: hypothetical protein Rubg2KO_02440 [Rubricoccaceae bacterium]